MDLQFILNSISGQVRRATLHGRSYLVAPMTMIVPGVLNGSQGALYYPQEEIGRDPSIWNGMPILHRHPEQGRSGREPEVIESQGLGTVFKARRTNDGTLNAEGWFDEERTKHIAPEIHRRLDNAVKGVQTTPVELSTGLFTDNYPAHNGARCPKTGRPYDFVARNYRADHLAVFTDQRGACSVSDGCGVAVKNAETPHDNADYYRELLGEKTTENAVAERSRLVFNEFSENSNPRGINQYTGKGQGGAGLVAAEATRTALAASKGAMSIADHSSAAVEHILAAKQHKSLGNIAEMGEHKALAEKHLLAAAEIKGRGRAIGLRNNRGQVVENDYGDPDDDLDDADELAEVEPSDLEDLEDLESGLPDTPGHFFVTLLHCATGVHLLHLQTRSFAAHTALDTLYKELPGHVDELVEAYQGRYGIVSEYPSGFEPPDTDSPADYVENVRDYVRAHRETVGDDTELQNIVDKIAGLLDSTVYKLRFLS